MLTKLKLTLFLMLIFLFSASVMASNDPYQEMQVAADTIFSRIKAESSQIKADPNKLKEIVKSDLIPYIQVKYAAALIIGNYYKTATTEQRNAYFSAFEDYLVQSMAQVLTMYNDQAYQIETPKEIGDKTLLSIRVLLLHTDKSQQPVRIDFLWRKNTRTGEWKAYDLVAEGVSMIATKQNEWSTLLRQSGIDALTKDLRKHASVKIDPNANKKG